MLKPITLHPSSVLVGLGLAALVVVASGAAQSAGSGRPVPTELRVVGHIPAAWWTSVYVEGATTYVVPSDRYFVVTYAQYQANLLVDGQAVDLTPVRETYSSAGIGSVDLSRGEDTRIVFAPSSVLSSPPSNSAQLWGYLEPVN